MLLFKYLSPDGLLKTLAKRKEIALRFGLPRTYNDPYELFLQPDSPLKDEELRGFYSFFLGKVLQAPVTCFSKRPDSVAMWAHYGREGTGACIAFDEDALANQFPVAVVGDVVYSHEPAQIEAEKIVHAFGTGKRRHLLWALAAGHRAAYFVKRDEWQYEAERRFVVPPGAVRKRKGMFISPLPSEVVRHIIVGARADKAAKELCHKRAVQLGVPFHQVQIGKNTYQPYFESRLVGSDAGRVDTMTWTGEAFEPCDNVCTKCGEPFEERDEDDFDDEDGFSYSGQCQWCAISPAARRSGPMRNALTISLHYGIDKGIPFAFAGLEPKGRDVRKDEPEEF
jgi:hypothetical protein